MRGRVLEFDGAVGFQIAGSGFLGTTIKNREEK